jgi:hypothetical protein
MFLNFDDYQILVELAACSFLSFVSLHSQIRLKQYAWY